MNQSEDPWARARDSQREDVAAALAPRERRCPNCGATQREAGRVCSNCGADLTQRAPRRIPWRPLLIAGAVVVAVAAISVPVVGALRDDAADERERAEQRQAQLIEQERARQVRDGRPVRARGPAPAADEDPLTYRARLLERAEQLLTADANKRIAAGTLSGAEIKGTDCGPFPETEARRAAENDPALNVGRYDCTAYSSKLEGNQRTAVFGHPFWLVIDYDRGAYVWCKVTPRAGEGGSVLVSVPVEKPCRDPAGPG
jgi:hypothetical protein